MSKGAASGSSAKAMEDGRAGPNLSPHDTTSKRPRGVSRVLRRLSGPAKGIAAGVLAANNVATAVGGLPKASTETDAALPGYPRLSGVLSHDDRLMVFRSFRWVQTRIVLEKQDELRVLESKLKRMDLEDWHKRDEPEDDQPMDQVPWRLTTRHRREPEEQERRARLLRDLETKFKEYADLLCRVKQIASFETPSDFDRENIRRWIGNTNEVIQAESEWIDRLDLVSIRGHNEHAALSEWLEKSLMWLRSLPTALPWHRSRDNGKSSISLQSRGTNVRADDCEESEVESEPEPEDETNIIRKAAKSDVVESWLRGNTKTERLTSQTIGVFLLLIIPSMFVLPIYALLRLRTSLGGSIGILLAFALVFTVLVEIGTTARPHEVLGCSAAYLAVLVVFFGNLSNN